MSLRPLIPIRYTPKLTATFPLLPMTHQRITWLGSPSVLLKTQNSEHPDTHQDTTWSWGLFTLSLPTPVLRASQIRPCPPLAPRPGLSQPGLSSRCKRRSGKGLWRRTHPSKAPSPALLLREGGNMGNVMCFAMSVFHNAGSVPAYNTCSYT